MANGREQHVHDGGRVQSNADGEAALRRDTDGELAYHALLEGEATLVMLDYLLSKSGQSFDEAVKSDFLINALGGAAAADWP